jgi:citrate synthase
MSNDVITVYGHDLVDEIMGKWSFSHFVYAALTGGVQPTSKQERMIDALLTTFLDHGVTPSSLATRLTLLGAPESVQAAIASGLCGAGSRYLGTMQAAAEMLEAALAGTDDLDRAARSIVSTARSDRQPIPGLGHPEHKNGDPRTPRLIELAKANDCFGTGSRLLLKVGETFEAMTGHKLPVNAAGLAGAIVLDMGLSPVAARGLAIISRAAGLVGVVLSEIREPKAQEIWDGLR